ncbi:OLC1v1008824C2 [Oldenlandia corymbosa var. corymbosa]|nr:OLC1v1008824C2 [Oldenlandia corymbosa var. corymbosa]
MTANEQSTNGHQLPYERDFEAQKKDVMAVLNLLQMKREPLDHGTTEELNEMMNKTLGRRRRNIEATNRIKSKSKQCLGSKDHQHLEDMDKENARKRRKIEFINEKFEPERCSSNMKKTIVYQCPNIGMGSDGCVLPDLPPIPEILNIIGKCSRPFEKQLTFSDLERSQNRLNFNKEYVQGALMPVLKAGEEDLNVGIPVTVFDCRDKRYSMRLKCWDRAHALNGGWNQFVDDRKELKTPFEKNVDWVTVWIFRHKISDELCGAITSRRLDTKDPIKRNRKTVVHHQALKS